MSITCDECGAEAPAHYGSCSHLSPEIREFVDRLSTETRPVDVAPRPAAPEPTYLGDGVYALFDGHQVWVWTYDGISESPRIAINQDTMSSLQRFWRRFV